MDALHALAESLSHAHPNKPKTVDCWLLDIGTPKNSQGCFFIFRSTAPAVRMGKAMIDVCFGHAPWRRR